MATNQCAPDKSSPHHNCSTPVVTPPLPYNSDIHPIRASQRLLVETIGPDRHLVFNPLSGAVDLCDDADLVQLRTLQRGEPVQLTETESAHLRERRYLFHSAAEEERLLESAVTTAWSRMQTLQPEAYTVCPTLACNLACAYCFEGDSLTDKPQGVMTEQQVDQLFQAIGTLRAQFAARGQISPSPPWIGLFGGEPLLPSTKRCVAHILRHAADGGFLVGATTNGVNIIRFEDVLREYADILTTFQVTLDGPKALHDSRRHRLGGQGTFDEIVQGIDLLLHLGIDVDLRVNVDASNLPALPELVAFLDEREWTKHSGFQLALAPVTDHTGQSGCGSKTSKVLAEMEMAQGVMALMEAHPRLADVCHVGFLRHLDYLVSVLEPEKHSGRRGTRPGPRYWYCEASTDKQFVFTPEGLIYSCTEAVGKPKHAIGQFAPELTIWQEQASQWMGRTILSHPECRACSISTLCGGGCNFAAKQQGLPKTLSDSLLQISMPKGQSNGGHSKIQSMKPAASAHPFCNGAEETVRAYLQHIGRQLA